MPPSDAITARLEAMCRRQDDHEERSDTARRDAFDLLNDKIDSLSSELKKLRDDVQILWAWKHKFATAVAVAMVMLTGLYPIVWFAMRASAVESAREVVAAELRRELGRMTLDHGGPEFVRK